MLCEHQADLRISCPAFADAGYSTLHVFLLLFGSSDAKTLPIADKQRNRTDWLMLINNWRWTEDHKVYNTLLTRTSEKWQCKLPLEGENATSRDRTSDCDTSSKTLAVPAPTTATWTLGLPAALALNQYDLLKHGSLILFWDHSDGVWSEMESLGVDFVRQYLFCGVSKWGKR